MKKIERPDSTTYIIEQSFHFIKDKEEALRIFELIEKSNPKPQLIPVLRSLDPNSFQPQVAFVVYYEGDVINECCKYIMPLELAAAANLDINLHLKPLSGGSINPSKVKIL